MRRYKYSLDKGTIKKGFPFLLAIVFSVALIASIVTTPPNNTDALSGSQFNAGRIIDDAVFYNSGSMSATSVQNFLKSKVPTCDTWGTKPSGHAGYATRADWGRANGAPPPYKCLKDYTQNTPARGGVSGQCAPLTAKSGRAAARIIDDVARACGVSQKVLLVLLQKEQSLVTDDWPWPIQYRSATGYGCPDTAPCDSQYYGFFNQVYNAALAYKRYRANPTNYNYRAKRNNTILWHPNTSCGSSTVYIQNQATAGLYIYTPYRPNQAALNNLYGTGNSCSSYGNRNFWRMFNDWFGSTTNVGNIVPVVYDNSTDVSGELATIGFKLTSKPKSSVSFLVKYNTSHVSSGEYRMTISPSNWNNPRRNIVILKGKNNSVNGNVTFNLTVGSLSSLDSRFNIGAAYTPDVPILHQDLSKKVYRLYNSDIGAHLFTGSGSERASLISQGWEDEGIGFYGCEAGNVALARLKKENSYKLLPYGSADYDAHIANGFVFQSLVTTTSNQANRTLYAKYRDSTSSVFYTLNPTEGDSAGFTPISPLGVCDNNISPIFRLYSSSAQDHFYTHSTGERNGARERHGFRYEGVAFYTTDGGTIPVYRLYSGRQGNHFYTASENEKNTARNHGFRYEGIAFRVHASNTAPIYRLHSGAAGNHFYTTSPSEKSSVQASGYRYEGVGFKAY